MTRIKICGITRPADAIAAVEAGAHALGFIFAESPRRVTPEATRVILDRLGPFATGVGVFVNEEPLAVLNALVASRCSVAQLHGDEGPEFLSELPSSIIVRAFRVRNRIGDEQLLPFRRAHAILLDTYVPGQPGGTGQQFDHRLAVDLVQRGWRVIVAGGLTPDNVYDVVTAVRPYGVDVSTGVESAPGRKDHHKVRDFIAAVRAADREQQ